MLELRASVCGELPIRSPVKYSGLSLPMRVPRTQDHQPNKGLPVRKLITTTLVCLSVAGVTAAPTLAVVPGAAVHNPNANANACWGMDRSYYASEKFFGDNMDI